MTEEHLDGGYSEYINLQLLIVPRSYTPPIALDDSRRPSFVQPSH